MTGTGREIGRDGEEAGVLTEETVDVRVRLLGRNLLRQSVEMPEGVDNLYRLNQAC